ncbi:MULTISPECIES: TusE/DsrC/DsvC family sulfur relay protein [Methylomonas]|uniref:Sulfurtransferase n=1 Tax=Methylomonas koyamae TaxID=702114 RepID=A0A177N1L8_9GAMM|nr:MULTISPECIES: TusE/DsrC/DsvC family sulfur relay protein [Methylomonas]NJA05695.1 TusE/DsrC/DsvC family sulfur relay protein [Methylococcaceae bacterium WWC4]OAI11836.1 sulfur relay protein TusE [Methylomonas koyamae]WGS86747.1 TusE/DsrC/DsvC family sulfur relay protein [Methylomonas sp. UP202]
MALIVDGAELATTDDGFLRSADLWNRNVADELARLEGLVIEEAHWEILLFIRDYYRKFQHLPNARMFVAAVRKTLGEEKGNSRYLQKLFPQGPLKYACKIAGLPKPPTCL